MINAYITTLIDASVAINCAEGDEAIGRAAFNWTCAAISTACHVACLWLAPWYLGWLISLLFGIIAAYVVAQINLSISEESFAAAGAKLGDAINCVRGLFTRKVAA